MSMSKFGFFSSKVTPWAEEASADIHRHPQVEALEQAGAARAFLDVNWTSKWNTKGLPNMTDFRVLQNGSAVEVDDNCVMMNGGNSRPAIEGKTDKQLVFNNGFGKIVTLHDILLNPKNHLKNATDSCLKKTKGNVDSERIVLCHHVLFVQCPEDKDEVEFALQTRHYQTTSMENPVQLWMMQYGSGSMNAATATPGGYQAHHARDQDFKPCWVKAKVSGVKASSRYEKELSDLSGDDKNTAIKEGLTPKGDIINVIQVALAPDDTKPYEDSESYHDPMAATIDSDAPVYRSLGAFTTEMEVGKKVEMPKDHSEKPNIKNPLYYMREGHIRGPGPVRVDQFKVVAVKGSLTEECIQDASNWLHERNKGQLVPLEEVAAMQIADMEAQNVSSEYVAKVTQKTEENLMKRTTDLFVDKPEKVTKHTLESSVTSPEQKA